MARRRKGRDIHGIILLDKPLGYSSSQAVQKVRWLFTARKAGHTGSLDPFATGMLPICLGEASKTAGFMLDASKRYLATAWLGQATATGDTEGDVLRQIPVPALTTKAIDAAFESFRGAIEQVPPMYSALKHQGQPLYKLARAGKEVERKSRSIIIHRLELITWQKPLLVFRVHCSKGTYVRTLAEDIAEKLGTCAHLQALRRLDVEPFREADMISLNELQRAAQEGQQDSLLLPLDTGLRNWPMVQLSGEEQVRFTHGNPAFVPEARRGNVRVYAHSGEILGLGEVRDGHKVHPKRLFIL
ncbi:MAG: tRNA pseudouridine(55) synthase TruB [Xanthomonadales bacterium]